MKSIEFAIQGLGLLNQHIDKHVKISTTISKTKEATCSCGRLVCNRCICLSELEKELANLEEKWKSF